MSKKLFSILLVTLMVVVLACSLFACNTEENNDDTVVNEQGLVRKCFPKCKRPY